MNLMKPFSEEQAKNNVIDAEKNPGNLKILNAAALAVMEYPTLIERDKDELYYFKQAYETQKTIVSTHNYAHCLGIEWGHLRDALNIQNECLVLKPKSGLSYFLHAYLCLCNDEPHQAIPSLIEAHNKLKLRSTGQCLGDAYFKTGQFEKALEIYQQLGQLFSCELDYFKQTLTYIKLGRYSEALALLEKLKETANFEEVSFYDLAEAYANMGYFELAKECINKEGVDGFDFSSWTALSYTLFLTDQLAFDQKVKEGVQTLSKDISDAKAKRACWSDASDEELKDGLTYYSEQLEIYENLGSEFEKNPPKLNIDIWVEYCGCLLFGCERHKNPETDQ